MNTTVSIQDKKNFIQWFLKNYQLKKRESVWILNYIVTHQEILKNTHFVRDVKFCPRGIVLTSRCSDEVPFRFYKNHLVTTDAEKSFHDIRLNDDEELYIQINFYQANQNPNYAYILEENPFIPSDYFVTSKDKQIATKILEETIFNYKKEKLLKAIDKALDELDQERFMMLSMKLNQLEDKKNRNNQPKLQKQ